MGSLALEGLDGNSWITLWATTGQQHANHQAPWTREEVALSGRTIKKIRFKGTTTDTDRRDAARGVLSPLLANIYLHPLDKLVTEAGMKMVRDDFVILCEDKTQAEEALWLVREWTEDNGLTLHPDKTHLGDCSQPGQGFEFLGYRFEAGRRWIRRKSIKALREKVRDKTRRTVAEAWGS